MSSKSKALPEEINERARELVRRILKHGVNGRHFTQEELAEEIDLAQSAISAMNNSKSNRGISAQSGKRLWALVGEDFDGDFNEAIGLPRASGPPKSTPDTSRILDESISAFERAAILARNSGVSEVSIQQAGKMRAFSGSASFRETDYLAAMLAAERERLGKPTTIEVVPEEPEDDPAARLKAAAKKKARR